MAVSQSISDLEYAAYLAANPGSKLSLADFKYKNLGGPQVGKSVTDLEYASLPATTPPPGTITDRKFKSLGGPSVPPQSLSDLKYATGGGTIPVPPFDPNTITGLQAWFKADGTKWKDIARSVPAVANGDLIGAWDDSSPNARNAINAIAPVSLTLKTNQANGMPCISRAGGGGADRLVTSGSGFLNAAPITVITVIKNAVADGQNENWIGANSAGQLASIATDPTNKSIMYGGNTLTGAAALSTTAPQIIAGQFNGAASRLYTNGGVPIGGDAGAQVLAGLTLFAYRADGSGSASGDMFEVLAYNKMLSLAELDQIGNYLATKYGIAWAPAQNPVVPPFNPLTLIPWHTAVWAEDPAWAHPADGVAVPSWHDGSGNGRDLVQATGSLQPIYRAVSATLNNRPAVEFDGVDDSLVVSAFTAVAPPYTLVLAGFRRGAGGGGNERAMCRVGGGAAIIMDPGTKKWICYNGNNLSSFAIYDTLAHLLAGGVIGPTTSYMNVDGLSGPLGDAGGGSINSLGLSIGQVPSDYGKMTIAFAALYQGDVTQHANWAAFKDGISTLYGINLVKVADNFNRADSATTLGNANTGQTWTYPAGVWGITSGSMCYTQTLGAQESVAAIDIAKQDSYVQAVVQAFANTNGMGLVARMSDLNNYYLLDTNGSTIYLYKKVGGAFTQLASTVKTVNLGDTLALSVVGTNMSVFQNGVSVLTGIDATVPPGTLVGMRNGEQGLNPGTARWDNFLVK